MRNSIDKQIKEDFNNNFLSNDCMRECLKKLRSIRNGTITSQDIDVVKYVYEFLRDRA